jgi:hypothetical protein
VQTVYLARQGAASTFLPAKLDGLRRLPSILRKRRDIQKKKTTTNLQMRAILRKSLFFDNWKKLHSVWKPDQTQSNSVPVCTSWLGRSRGYFRPGDPNKAILRLSPKVYNRLYP